MTMPDGTILEGYFEMNVYKGPLHREEEVIQEVINEETKESQYTIDNELIKDEFSQTKSIYKSPSSV
jgi:hypothetical protein